jgi:hypothetical protein
MDRWYSADELRQSWCLLSLDLQTGSDVYIRACEIGDGNADKLIETETLTAEDSQEEVQLLETIGAKLDERRYNGVSLITPSHETLAILRTRFLECDSIKQPTLRGFDHVAVVELLETYFCDKWTDKQPDLIDKREGNNAKSKDDKQFVIDDASVAALWKARAAIGPLVPPEAVQGTPL